MSQAIKKALILAAGSGLRLNDVTQGYPKGFLIFGEKPIIEESIDKLLEYDIKEIVIVTGYADSCFEALKEKYDCIYTIKNEIFSTSGSLYSFCLARDLIHEDFLLLESDLIYEKRALPEIIDFPPKDCVLLSGPTNSGDEVYVGASGDVISHMSKNINEVPNIVGEIAGISKISHQLYHKIIEMAERQFKRIPPHEHDKLDYDIHGIMEAGKHTNVYYNVVYDLAWAEIDDANHYHRAKNQVYPTIVEADGKN